MKHKVPDDLKAQPNPNEQEPGSAETKRSGGGFTRRSLLVGLGAAGAVVNNPAQLPAQTDASAGPAQFVPVVLKVNGRTYRLRLESRVTLLDTLREHLQLFGTKKGCDHGQCGACTLHVNGRRVNSCLTFAIMHQSDEITTIEGLARNGRLHPVQAAFLEHDGFQCGYCTSGQIMSAAALLNEPCGTDDDSVRECMSGNICRCGAYMNIVAAVQAARRRSG